MRLSNKGQAILELAVFGSLILLVLGVLLNYMQQLGDQQYVQMEAFRRGLAKAARFPGLLPSIPGFPQLGAGASVDYTVIRNRRFAGVNNDFKKGEPATVSASSSVYWAVPRIAKNIKPSSMSVYKINDDERTLVMETLLSLLPSLDIEIPEIGGSPITDWLTYTTEKIDSHAETHYVGDFIKRELPRNSEDNFPGSIATHRTSRLNDRLQTRIYTTFRPRIPSEFLDLDDEVLESLINTIQSTVIEDLLTELSIPTGFPGHVLNQGLYRNALGQPSYREAVPVNHEVARGRRWETEFR